jgi:hypothetical protein
MCKQYSSKYENGKLEKKCKISVIMYNLYLVDTPRILNFTKNLNSVIFLKNSFRSTVSQRYGI